MSNNRSIADEARGRWRMDAVWLELETIADGLEETQLVDETLQAAQGLMVLGRLQEYQDYLFYGGNGYENVYVLALMVRVVRRVTREMPAGLIVMAEE